MPAVRRDPVDELADIVLAMNPADLERWCLNLTGADLELIESIVAGSRHHAWVPLPHQIPPSNDDPWELWLLLGGRGTGKTDACAADMDAHAKGPPCLPGLPGGHRMAIIAPTRGDASDSCVNSPAGLKAHNPLVREVTRKGGTVVLWPNGAEAKLFGAFTPEDVERLRAGGNRSLVVGTMIETANGPVPIEQVQAGDRVWTDAGLRPVLVSQSHGWREFMTVTTDAGRVLHLTGDHEVWVCDQGWTRADGLDVGSRLSAWNGAVTAGNDSARTGHEQSEDLTGPQPPSCCTGSSTNTTTDRYRTATRSTTSTATSPTTTRPTSSPSIPRPTSPSTSVTERGTPLVAELLTRPPVRASSVASQQLDPGSAHDDAGEPGSAPKPRPAGCGHVWCAEAVSTVPPTQPPSLVHDRVATISHGNVAAPVWDLTVAGEHDFVADGILVSNCRVWCEELAAWRYLRACWNHMTLGLRLGSSPRAIASTTPKNRKHLRKLIADPNTIVTTASTYDNPHLAAEVRAKYERLYKGTRLGRQELLAELLDDVEGALWNLAGIEADRVDERAQYRRIVVGVDPSWGTTNDECGIVVAGATWTDEAHVLADYSIRGGPSVWAESVAEAFWTWQADIVAAEGNFQGEQVRLAMGQVEHPLGAPATKLVNASRGKVLRAEPVVMLYEQHRVHHLGVLEGLEYQMTTWVPGAKADDHDEDDDADLQADVAQGSNIEHEGSQDDDELAVSEYSPDRIDALVFAVTDLLLGESGTPLVVRQQRRLDKPSVERSVGMRTPRRVGRRL